MQRRTVILGAAVTAVIAIPANAQTSNTTGTGPGGLSQAAEQYIQDTLQTGALSLVTSRIALQKASDPQVKQFAQFELAEQVALEEVLSSMRPSTTVGAGGMSRSRNAPQLDQKGQQLVKKLQDESSGAEFDRDYVHAQLEGHHQLLQIQERYLNAGQEPDVANVAKLARVIIREHMALLDDINSRLKG